MKTIIARFQELKKTPDEIGDVEGEEVNANKIEEALRSIDVDLRDTTGQFRDFDDVIFDISSKWDSLDTNTQRYIATVAAGARQQSRFIALVADNQRLMELAGAATDSAGSSDKQFEKTMDSLTAKLNVLRDAYHEFILGILDSDVIKGGVDLLTGLFTALNNLADLTGPLSGLSKVLMTIGAFLGGRALIHNAVSTLSGAGTNLLATAIAAGTGRDIADAQKRAKEDRKAKKAGKAKGGLTSAAGSFLGTLAGGLGENILGQFLEMDAGKGFKRTGGFLGALVGGKGASNFTKNIADLSSSKLRDEAEELRKQKSNYLSPGFNSPKMADRLDREADRKDKNKTFLGKRENALRNKGFDKAANSVSMLASGLAKIPGPAKAAAAAVAAVGAAYLIKEKIDAKRIEKMDALVAKHEEAQTLYETNKATLSSLAEEYETLSKGVNRNGKNIALSAEQYERYGEIAKQIADISPEAVESVDIEGNIILKDDAIKEAQKALEFDMQLKDAELASTDGLETLVKGAKAASDDIRKNYKQDANDLLSIYRSGLLSGGYDNYGLTQQIKPAMRGVPREDSYLIQTKNLETLYNQRYEIIKDAKENLNEIIKEHGTTSKEYEEAASEYLDLQNLLNQGGQLQEELKAERAPIIEALKTYADYEMKTGEIKVPSLVDKIAEDNEKLFNQFIEDTALNEKLDASTMQDYVKYASEQLSQTSTIGAKIADAFDSIENAKDSFDESLKDSSAVDEYNDAINTSVSALEGYAQKLREQGTEEASALADSLESQISSLKSYASEAKITIGEAFNDMKEEIASANKVQEEYATKTADGDYYTGRQNFKQIYDEITSDLNFAGGGSKSFWAGAELMLDTNWLRKNAGNVDVVKQKIEGLKTSLEDGEAGAQAFGTTLASSLEGLSKEELDKVGLYLEDGAIKFDQFTDDKLPELAKLLGYSEELTTAMLNNIRQFSDVNFDNIDSVVTSMEDSGFGVKDKTGKRAVSRSALQKESGMTLPEYEEFVNQPRTRDRLTLLDYQASDIEGLKTFVGSMKTVSDAIFDGKIAEGATDLSGYTLRLDDYIAASHSVEASQEEATELLENLESKGVTIDDLEENESLSEAVEEGYEALDGTADPLEQASSSMDNAASAMMALAAVMGTPYNQNRADEMKKQVFGKDNGLYDSGKSTGIPYDFNPDWKDTDYQQAEDRVSTARSLYEQNMAAAQAAEQRGLSGKAYRDDADLYNRRAAAIQNTIDQHKAYESGQSLNIGGTEYTSDQIKKFINFKDNYERTTGKVFESELASKRENLYTDFEKDKSLETIPDVVKKKLEFEITNEGAIDELANKITGLTDSQHEIVVDAITAAANGNVDEFNNLIKQLPPEVQTQVISLLTGDDPATVTEEIENIPEEKPVSVTVEEKGLNKLQEAFSGQKTLTSSVELQPTGQDTITSEAQAAVDAVDGTVKITPNTNGMAAKIRAAAAGISINVPVSLSISGTTGGGGGQPKKKKKKKGTTAKGANYNSAANGRGEGRLGPNGTGGLTLTGELGPELVWLPSQNTSFMVGEDGPQLIPLPGNAVVYPADITKNIIDQNRPVTNFGSSASGSFKLSNPSPSGSGSSSKKGRGSNPTSSGAKSAKGSSSDDKDSEKWENEIDWLYNLTEDINELLRDREKLEKRYDLILKQQKSSITEILDLTHKQIANLEKERDMQQEMLDKRNQEMREYLEKNADLQKYASFNWDDRTIEIDWEAINAVTDEDTGTKIDDYLSKLEDIQDKMDDAEDALLDIDDSIQELKDRGEDQYFKLEDRVIKALEQIDQNEIDRLSEINSSISKADSDLVNSISRAVDKQRQQRDNLKTEENLGEMQRRLAYLRQDTSGMNDLEIKQTEEALEEQQQDYGDILVDQKLEEIQLQNDLAAEQRERQIAILEEQLNWNRESGEYAQQARDYILEARTQLQNGVPLEDTDLTKILAIGENWQRDSWQKHIDAMYELVGMANEAMAWLGLREETDYQAEINKIFTEVLDNPNLSYEEKAQGIQRIDLLEQERDAKIAEEGRPEAQTHGAQAALARSYIVNHAENMQKALGSTINAEEFAKSEQLRNAKLDKKGEQWRKTYFSGVVAQTAELLKTKDFSGDKTDYRALIDKAIKNGEWGAAMQYELMRDAKIRQQGRSEGQTHGKLTMDAFYNRDPSKDQVQTHTSMFKKGFKTGGLADYTGPAWVDGTKSKPELVLNAEDTSNFIKLKDILSDFMNQSFGTGASSSGDNYYEISINVDKVTSDYDVEKMADKIKKIIHKDSMYRNVNSINFLR